MAYLAKRHSSWAILLLNAVIVVTDRLQSGRPRRPLKISQNAAAICPTFNCAL